MIRLPEHSSDSYLNSPQKSKFQSPYKKLESSPTRKNIRPSLAIADQLKKEHSHHIIENQDFNKRLEEIKRKYTSPVKHPKIVSTPMTPVDFNLPSKRSTITNQNIIKTKQEYTPMKAIKTVLDIPRPTQNTARQALETISSFPSQTVNQPVSQFSSTNNQSMKKIQDDQRINSIDKINEKIKSILDGINYQNDKFCDRPRMTESFDQKGLAGILSARPEQPRERQRERRQMFSHASLEKDPKPIETVNRSIAPSSANNTKQARYTSRDFESKMQEIQQRIKKSEENRHKAMESLQSKEPSAIVPSTHTQTQKLITQTSVKQQHFRQRSNTGSYSHRYIDFGKNKSRNIMEELKSFSKQQPAQPSQKASEDSITPVKNQTRKLINSLVQQVKLDEQLRNGKIWLQINNDPDKWSKLRQTLSKRESKSYTEEEVKGIFKCTQQDHNPFFVNQPHQSLNNLVSKYIDTETNWRNTINKKFDIKLLSQQGFKSEVLDLELKGYLQIEDIVRYLNIETGRFYRNRDLALIFKRVTKVNRLSFEEFVKTICY